MVHHKTTEAGKAERLSTLRRAFSDIDEHTHTWLPGSRPDDLLDAFVAAWNARRWVTGSYQRLGVMSTSGACEWKSSPEHWWG